MPVFFTFFLSVTLLSDKFCVCNFATNIVDRSGFGMNGYENDCSCASAFNFVSMLLGDADTEC